MAFYRCGAGSEYPDLMSMMTSSGSFDLADCRTKAWHVPQYMFYSNSSVRDLNDQNISQLDSYSFYRCSNLRDIDMPELTHIFEHTLDCRRSYYKNRVSINAPRLFTIENYGFYDFCAQDATAEVDFPKLKNIKNYAFGASGNSYAWILKKMTLGHPDGVVLGTYCFQRAQIETIDITSPDAVSSFGNHVFANATITNLIIRSSNLATLDAGNDLGAAPTNIYVPDALVDTYKITPAWNSYETAFKPLSDIEPEEEAEEE